MTLSKVHGKLNDELNVCYVAHVVLLLRILNVLRNDDVEPNLGLMLVENLCYVLSYVEKFISP